MVLALKAVFLNFLAVCLHTVQVLKLHPEEINLRSFKDFLGPKLSKFKTYTNQNVA
mgnify:CR=1